MEPQITIKCNKDRTIHSHSTIDELLACVGSRTLDIMAIVGPAPATAAPSAPYAGRTGAPVGSTTPGAPDPATGAVKVVHKEAGPTVPQLGMIAKLGGSWRDAFLGNRAEASVIIGALSSDDTREAFEMPITEPLDADEWEMFPQERAWRRHELGEEWKSYHAGGENGAARLWQPEKDTTAMGGPVTGNRFPSATYSTPKPADPISVMPDQEPDEPVAKVMSPKERLTPMLPLLANVKDGYYAAEVGDGRYNDLKFFRVSRPKTGQYAGTTKIQWQIADNWRIAILVRANGTYWKPTDAPAQAEDYVLAIMVDATGCARRYAKEIDKCCRCNTSLTDERSRHYGIGPECEKHWPHIIELVDLEDQLRQEEEAKKW